MTISKQVIKVLAGPERGRRWSVDEKLALVRQSFETGKMVSMVARQHGLNPNPLFYGRKLYRDGSLSAVAAGEDVVVASQPANPREVVTMRHRHKRSAALSPTCPATAIAALGHAFVVSAKQAACHW